MSNPSGFDLLLSALDRASASGEDDLTHAKHLAFQALADEFQTFIQPHHLQHGGTFDSEELIAALMTFLAALARLNHISPLSLLVLFTEAYNSEG